MQLRPGSSVLLAVVLAACSSEPAQTAGSSTAAAAATGPASSAATAGPTSGASPETSVAPTTDNLPDASAPIPTATAAATGGWTTILAPLKLPAAYVDLGFAGNGDLMVLGTDDITARPATVWVARYGPDGGGSSGGGAGTARTPTAKITLAKKVYLLTSRDFFHVDPSNDSLVFTQVDFSNGYWHAYRFSSTTGKELANLKLNAGATYVVPTPAGKLLGITPTYGGPNNERGCVIIRVGSTGGISSGIDSFTEPCKTVGYSKPGTAYFGQPASLDVTDSGNVLLLDWAEAGFRRDKEPSGLGISVLTAGLTFIRHVHLPEDWQVADIDRGVSQWGATLAGDSGGRLYLLQELRSTDGSTRTGIRLGVFDTDGTIVATFGFGGDSGGLDGPITARIAPDDRLWAVDVDTVAKGYVVKRLDAPLP